MRKNPIERADALALARAARVLHAKKGKNVKSLDINADKPSDAELAPLILGRSGTMRAPVLRIEDTLIAGWSEELARAALGMD